MSRLLSRLLGIGARAVVGSVVALWAWLSPLSARTIGHRRASWALFTAICDTVNMAQRFQSLARPGQVVTGQRTTALLDDDIDIEWLDEVIVKGKSDPVRPCVLRRAAR